MQITPVEVAIISGGLLVLIFAIALITILVMKRKYKQEDANSYKRSGNALERTEFSQRLSQRLEEEKEQTGNNIPGGSGATLPVRRTLSLKQNKPQESDSDPYDY